MSVLVEYFNQEVRKIRTEDDVKYFALPTREESNIGNI